MSTNGWNTWADYQDSAGSNNQQQQQQQSWDYSDYSQPKQQPPPQQQQNGYYSGGQQQSGWQDWSTPASGQDFGGGFSGGPGYGQPPPQQQQQQQQFGGFPFAGQQFDPMLSAAQQLGGQFAAQQREKLTRYITGFNLKYYFAVDNAYVGKKLGLLLLPFFHRDWGVRHAGSTDPVPAREDVNAPDLYIPLMAFITYVCVSGFVLGTQGRFSPEMLGILMSNALIWVILENFVIFIAKYVMNISQSLSLWHHLSYSTYKFFGMILCLLMFLAGGKSFYYATLAYTSFALVFFLLRTVKHFVFDADYSGADARKRKLLLVLFILVSQPLIMWWLTSGVTSFNYDEYNFAQLAMKNLGFSGNKAAANLPRTASGDVDYEALLKMPK